MCVCLMGDVGVAWVGLPLAFLTIPVSLLSLFSFSRLRCCQPQKNLFCCCSNHLYSPRTEYSACLLVFTVYIALSLCLIRISHAAYIMHKTVIHSLWGQTLFHAHVWCVNHEDYAGEFCLALGLNTTKCPIHILHSVYLFITN